jgi:hypothetical protein
MLLQQRHILAQAEINLPRRVFSGGQAPFQLTEVIADILLLLIQLEIF